MTLLPFRNQIALSPLFNKDGYDIHLRMMKDAAKAVSIENAVNNMLRVQMRFVDIRQDRNPRPF
jgi:hypothetical protein